MSMNTVTKKWNTATLNSAIDVVKEPWYPSDEDTNYIGLEHINQNELSLNGIGRSVSLESNKSRFSAGDILFGKLRPYFRKVVRVDFEGVCSTDILVLRAKEGFDQDFIFYFVANPVFISRSTGASTGTRMPRADWKYLGETKWAFPELPEQEAVAGVLKSLDKKIELLRKQNETLEEMAKAIFHEWFVEFNFPDKNGKPYKASGGKMIQSELGEIPEGWEVKPASAIADISIGRTPPRKETEWFSLSPKDIKWVSIKDMGGAGVYLKNTSEYLTREAVEQFSIPVIPANTVIVSFKLTVGRVAITTEEMLSNEAIAHFVQKNRNETPTEYIYLWLKNFAFGTLGSTSSIANATNSQAIKQIPFLVPETSVMEAFSPFTSALFGRISANTTSIESLSVIRDTLLPKLMSGEVRVNV